MFMVGGDMTDPRRCRRAGRRLSAVCSVLLSGALTASATSEVHVAWSELVRAVPTDIAAAYFLAGRDHVHSPGDARSGTESTVRPTMLTLARFLVDRASETGFLSHVDMTVRAWLESLAAALLIMEYPHAVALFAFDAAPRADGGHELAGLELALIIRAGDGVTEKIERRIQHLLNVFTT